MRAIGGGTREKLAAQLREISALMTKAAEQLEAGEELAACATLLATMEKLDGFKATNVGRA